MDKRATDVVIRQLSSYGRLAEQLRARTFKPAQRHRIYFSFIRQTNGWHCRFHNDDLGRSPISKHFIFQDPRKIHAIVRRGHGLNQAETSEPIDQAIAAGHGGFWLSLSDEQLNAVTSGRPERSLDATSNHS